MIYKLFIYVIYGPGTLRNDLKTVMFHFDICNHVYKICNIESRNYIKNRPYIPIHIKFINCK